MKSILFILIWLAVGFLIGFILGARKPKPDGIIFLEKNEEGDDRIRFYLNMEYDDIADHDQIFFKVER